MTRSVMIAYDQAFEIRDMLDSAFRDISFSCVSRSPELQERLNQFNPEIVFSIKGHDFPGDAHRPIMSHPSAKWVQVGGSGYEHLGSRETSVCTVTNCAGVLAKYLAETVTGAMICLTRKLSQLLAN